MNQRAAFDETVALAEKSGMQSRTVLDSSLGFEHLLDMQKRIAGGDFSEAKLGRWLGWAQAALVAANVGVGLEDVKQINLRHAGFDNKPLEIEQIADFWDWDISDSWVRERLAKRITDAGYEVVRRG